MSRSQYGAFLVAGPSPGCSVRFFGGTMLAHRGDYRAPLDTLRAAQHALRGLGISSIKLLEYGVVQFCATCGANLRRFYGADGGKLRDVEFVHALASPQ